MQILSSHTEANLIYPPFYSPCKFPVPSMEVEHRQVCNINRHLPFLCDLHGQLGRGHNGLYNAIQSYAKHKPVLQENGTNQIGILLVRQLASPITTSVLTPDNEEFGCIFQQPCAIMSPEKIDKFVNNFRTFTKIYTSALHMRWFPHEKCLRSRVLALVVVDGLISDPRKLTTVVLYSDDARMNPFVSNIQLESTNAILQGVPLEEVIADLIDQIGYAYRDFYSNKGVPRTYSIPLWAWEIAGFSVSMVLLALLVEWVIVRRKINVRRSIAGLPISTIKSKTHMMF
uniref:Uncharacterized protein n=1 Tax=Acrobeloides nanus TaxID=290746 RepID=A0A914D000_9BILA